MHKNNPHTADYDFDKLVDSNPVLQDYIEISPARKETIDFSDSKAVFELNKALLISQYNLRDWHLPETNLCPPIPSRIDYLLYLNDLLENKKSIRGLDIGVGASCIYPLLGAAHLGWELTGVDRNEASVNSAKENVNLNIHLADKISILLQKDPSRIFEGIIFPSDSYDFTMCNPPFFSSEKEALAANKSKNKNLNLKGGRNFSGEAQELWCNGGEALFIKRMIKQSILFKTQVKWFTTLVSKKENLIKFEKQLKKLKAEIKILDMSQGNKRSRILAWRFPS